MYTLYIKLVKHLAIRLFSAWRQFGTYPLKSCFCTTTLTRSIGFCVCMSFKFCQYPVTFHKTNIFSPIRHIHTLSLCYISLFWWIITSLLANSMDFVCTSEALPSQSGDVAHSPSCQCGGTETWFQRICTKLSPSAK